MLRRVIVLLVLLAAATVPLARAQDPGTQTTGGTPVATLGDPAATTVDPAATTAPAPTPPPTSGVVPEGVTIQGVPRVA